MKKAIFAALTVLSLTLASAIVAPAGAFDSRHQFGASEGNG
jgi:hypothetical protein